MKSGCHIDTLSSCREICIIEELEFLRRIEDCIEGISLPTENYLYSRIRNIDDCITAFLYENILLDREKLSDSMSSVSYDKKWNSLICRYDFIIKNDDSIIISTREFLYAEYI